MNTRMVDESQNEMLALPGTVKKLLAQMDYARCEALIAEAMKRYPHAAQPHNLMGILLEQQNAHPAAMSHFRAAWSLDPTYAPARDNLDTFGTFFSTGHAAYGDGGCDEPSAAASTKKPDDNALSTKTEVFPMKWHRNKKETSGYTIIIGCGRLGASLANTLSEKNGNVLIIDKDKESFRKLSPAFGGIELEGDATDTDLLREAHIAQADTVVAVTNNDNINITAAQIAHEVFHVKHVIARLYDLERECVYREFGIDTISPTTLSVDAIDRILHEKTAGGGVGDEKDSTSGGRPEQGKIAGRFTA